jgi:hypothetical protein
MIQQREANGRTWVVSGPQHECQIHMTVSPVNDHSQLKTEKAVNATSECTKSLRKQIIHN